MTVTSLRLLKEGRKKKRNFFAEAAAKCRFISKFNSFPPDRDQGPSLKPKHY